jgi:superfamily II DNA or RNA helicase
VVHREKFGGRDRDRTGDPLLATIGRTKNQQVSQSELENSRRVPLAHNRPPDPTSSPLRQPAFLGLPITNIGQIGGGKSKRTGIIDVAVIQSLQRKGSVLDFVAEYGHVIVDECHHLSAFTFERVLREVKAKYVLGLTATPTRKDGHHPIIYMQCGPIRFHLSPKKAAESSPLEHKVIP